MCISFPFVIENEAAVRLSLFMWIVTASVCCNQMLKTEFPAFIAVLIRLTNLR